MVQAFQMEYWRDEAYFVGRLRGVPGVFSQGETLEELEENLRDAYRMMQLDSMAPPQGAMSKPIEIES